MSTTGYNLYMWVMSKITKGIILEKIKKARGYGLKRLSSFQKFTEIIIHNQKIKSPGQNHKLWNS